jgi:hypothetical protein
MNLNNVKTYKSIGILGDGHIHLHCICLLWKNIHEPLEGQGYNVTVGIQNVPQVLNTTWSQARSTILEDGGSFMKWALDGEIRSWRMREHVLHAVSCSWTLCISLCFLSAIRWTASCSHVLSHWGRKFCWDKDYRLKYLKPWAKVNPSSFKLFLSDICHCGD